MPPFAAADQLAMFGGAERYTHAPSRAILLESDRRLNDAGDSKAGRTDLSFGEAPHMLGHFCMVCVKDDFHRNYPPWFLVKTLAAGALPSPARSDPT